MEPRVSVTTLVSALLATLLVRQTACQFFGFGGGRYPSYGRPPSPRPSAAAEGWGRRWGDAEWFTPQHGGPPAHHLHEEEDEEEEEGGVRCPANLRCVVRAQCDTLPPRTLRIYCGWAGGPLVCCPPAKRRSGAGTTPPGRKPAAAPSKPQQHRCGLAEGRGGSGQGYGPNRILSAAIGGVPLRTAQSSPWMVAVGERSRASARGRASGSIDWYCGGSLVGAQWVLTAAHCAVRRRPDVVRVGELDFSRTDEAAAPRDVAVTNVTLHPEYRPPSFYHDLALLRLREPAPPSRFVRPVCLPPPGFKQALDGAIAMLTGWGHTEFGGERSDVLQEVGVTIIPRTECGAAYSRLAVSRRNYPEGITAGLLCAGDSVTGGKDACQGDSGGPLVLQDGEVFTQVGVVSSGVGCGNKNFPGVYVRVSSYTEWLRAVMDSEQTAATLAPRVQNSTSRPVVPSLHEHPFG